VRKADNLTNISEPSPGSEYQTVPSGSRQCDRTLQEDTAGRVAADGNVYPLKTESESESELLYDWRFTANQFVLASSPLRPTTRDLFSTEPLLY
jgi:hypothetical protein